MLDASESKLISNFWFLGVRFCFEISIVWDNRSGSVKGLEVSRVGCR